MKKLRILLFLGVFIAVVGGIIFRVVTKAPVSPYEFVTVERGTLVERVLATGKVEPPSRLSLEFRSNGKAVDVSAHVGDAVEAGALLAALERNELSAQLAQELAVLDFAKAQYDQTARGPREEAIAVAEAQVEVAKANLNKAIEGASEADIAVAERTVASAQTAFDNTQIALADARIVAEAQLDDVYRDTIDIFPDIRLKAEAAVQALNNFYTFDSNYRIWHTRGTFVSSDAARLQAETHKPLDDAARDRIITTTDSLDSASPADAIDAAISILQEDLETIRLGMIYTYNALQRDADKTTVKTAWTDLNSVTTQLTTQTQTITSIKNANTSAINSAEAAVKSAEAQLQNAEAQLVLKKELPRESDLAPLRAQIVQAAAQLAQTKAKVLPEDLAAAQAKIEQAAAGVALVRTQLANFEIRAPTAGVITAVRIEPGEIAKTGAIAIEMVPLTAFFVEANIPEADIAKITPGNPLDLTLDAIPDHVFQGVVLTIDPAEEEIGGIVTYRIKASIEDANERVKPGMTANLDIETDRRDNALFVPQRAVIEENGKRYVRVLRSDTPEKIEVTAGIRSADGMREVLTGVQEGQEIINFIRER